MWQKTKWVKTALGEHIYTSFLGAKRIEWASYATFVSQWEVDNYLDLYWNKSKERLGQKSSLSMTLLVVEQDAVAGVGSTTLISSTFYSPTQLCGSGTTKSILTNDRFLSHSLFDPQKVTINQLKQWFQLVVY